MFAIQCFSRIIAPSEPNFWIILFFRLISTLASGLPFYSVSSLTGTPEQNATTITANMDMVEGNFSIPAENFTAEETEVYKSSTLWSNPIDGQRTDTAIDLIMEQVSSDVSQVNIAAESLQAQATTDDIGITKGNTDIIVTKTSTDFFHLTSDVSVPKIAADVSHYTTGVSVPQTTLDVPRSTSDGSVLQTTSDMAQATSDVLQTTPDILQSTTDLPQATSNIPRTKSDVPQTTSNHPQTKSDFLQTTSHLQTTSAASVMNTTSNVTVLQTTPDVTVHNTTSGKPVHLTTSEVTASQTSTSDAVVLHTSKVAVPQTISTVSDVSALLTTSEFTHPKTISATHKTDNLLGVKSSTSSSFIPIADSTVSTSINESSATDFENRTDSFLLQKNSSVESFMTGNDSYEFQPSTNDSVLDSPIGNSSFGLEVDLPNTNLSSDFWLGSTNGSNELTELSNASQPIMTLLNSLDYFKFIQEQTVGEMLHTVDNRSSNVTTEDDDDTRPTYPAVNEDLTEPVVETPEYLQEENYYYVSHKDMNHIEKPKYIRERDRDLSGRLQVAGTGTISDMTGVSTTSAAESTDEASSPATTTGGNDVNTSDEITSEDVTTASDETTSDQVTRTSNDVTTASGDVTTGETDATTGVSMATTSDFATMTGGIETTSASEDIMQTIVPEVTDMETTHDDGTTSTETYEPLSTVKRETVQTTERNYGRMRTTSSIDWESIENEVEQLEARLKNEGRSFSLEEIQNATALLQKFNLKPRDFDLEIIEFLINDPEGAELYLDSQFGSGAKQQTTPPPRSLAEVLLDWLYDGDEPVSQYREIYWECSFDSATDPLCGMTQDMCDYGNWQVAGGYSPNYPKSGPHRDQTVRDQMGYALFDSTLFHGGEFADLVTPDLDLPEDFDTCMHVYLHMTGKEESQFKVYALINDSDAQLLWGQMKPVTVGGDDRWAKRQFRLPVGTRQLVLRAFKGKQWGPGEFADIAMDGLAIDNEVPCAESPPNARDYPWEKMPQLYAPLPGKPEGEALQAVADVTAPAESSNETNFSTSSDDNVTLFVPETGPKLLKSKAEYVRFNCYTMFVLVFGILLYL